MVDLYKPIPPLKDMGEWKKLSIIECGEPLVPIGPFSRYILATSAIYAGERRDSPYPYGQLEGALLTTFVRESVAKRLAQVAKRLPPRHMLLVWDAYRPLTVQRALFTYYFDVLTKQGLSHGKAMIAAQTFVSLPSENPTCPPPHNTGGAVDLTIIRFDTADWKQMLGFARCAHIGAISIQEAELGRNKLIREASVPLNMGTVFDAVQPETATRFYEDFHPNQLTSEQLEIRYNRRLLYNAMASAGLSNYPAEWWHYDDGNQFAMACTGRQAIYGAAHLSAENERHEEMYQAWYESLTEDKRGTIHSQAVAL